MDDCGYYCVNLSLFLENYVQYKKLFGGLLMEGLNSYMRRFHAYKQNWDPVLRRRYSRITEEKNEHDEYTVVVVNDEKVVEHIPLRLSKIMSVFLKLTGSHMKVEVTGKYVNRKTGYVLAVAGYQRKLI